LFVLLKKMKPACALASVALFSTANALRFQYAQGEDISAHEFVVPNDPVGISWISISIVAAATVLILWMSCSKSEEEFDVVTLKADKQVFICIEVGKATKPRCADICEEKEEATQPSCLAVEESATPKPLRSCKVWKERPTPEKDEMSEKAKSKSTAAEQGVETSKTAAETVADPEAAKSKADAKRADPSRPGSVSGGETPLKLTSEPHTGIHEKILKRPSWADICEEEDGRDVGERKVEQYGGSSLCTDCFWDMFAMYRQKVPKA